jgi:hypothetical protein
MSAYIDAVQSKKQYHCEEVLETSRNKIVRGREASNFEQTFHSRRFLTDQLLVSFRAGQHQRWAACNALQIALVLNDELLATLCSSTQSLTYLGAEIDKGIWGYVYPPPPPRRAVTRRIPPTGGSNQSVPPYPPPPPPDANTYPSLPGGRVGGR